MSSVTAALGSNGAPNRFQWRNKWYTIQPITWGLISQLERKLINRDLEAMIDANALLVQRGIMSPEALAEKVDLFVDRAVQEGKYSFGSKRMQAVFKGIEKEPEKDENGNELPFSVSDMPELSGKIELVCLLLGTKPDDVVEMFLEIGPALIARLKLTLNEGMPAPKGQAAEVVMA